jgi:hypothetical protein
VSEWKCKHCWEAFYYYAAASSLPPHSGHTHALTHSLTHSLAHSLTVRALYVFRQIYSLEVACLAPV